MNGKNGPARLRFLIAAVILLVLMCALWLPRRSIVPPVVNVAFLGFTNIGSSHEALFAFTNPPPVAVNVHSVSGIAAQGHNGKSRGDFSWGRRESWGLMYAVWVDTTNEPLRVVFEFHPRATGRKRILEQIRELYGKLIGKEKVFFSGPRFFVTNEIRISTNSQ